MLEAKLLRLLAYGAAALILVVVVGGFITDPFGWKERVAQSWRGKAETATAQAAISGGEAEVGRQAVGVVADLGRRDAATTSIQEGNRHAILQAPGAAAPLDPDLAGRFLDGLCRYDAYAADPRCAGLRPVQGAAEGEDAGRPATDP